MADIKKQITTIGGIKLKTGGKYCPNDIIVTAPLKEETVALNLASGNQVVTPTSIGTTTLNLSTDVTNSKEGATYGFTYGTKSGYTGLYPTNASVDSSFAYAKLTFNVPVKGNVVVSYYQGSEKNYDYGTLSKIDTTLGKSTTDDSSTLYALFNKGNTGASSYTYTNVSAGTHFITVKYKKDSSASTSPDMFMITSITVPKAPEIGFSKVTITKPSTLIASNIVNGVNIAGVTGTYAGIIPTGTITLTQNGSADVGQYKYATVAIPVWDGSYTEKDPKEDSIYGYWTFNSSISGLSTKTFNVKFTSNETEFTSINTSSGTIKYNSITAYVDPVWVNSDYMTIKISSLSDEVTNVSELVSFLQANAQRGILVDTSSN